MNICPINPGPHAALAASWTVAYPQLTIVPGYQVDAGSQGDWPRSTDIGAADVVAHFEATATKFRRAIPEGSPSGIVSIDVECRSPFWHAISTGWWQEGYVQRVGAWMHFVRWLLRNDPPMRYALYGWPSRMEAAQYFTNYRAASETIAPLLREFDIITPSIYDPKAGGFIGDTQAVYLALEETGRLAAMLGKPAWPQMHIRHHVGDHAGELVPLSEWRSRLRLVAARAAAASVEGTILWSAANDESVAEQTAHAMQHQGYGDAIVEAFKL